MPRRSELFGERLREAVAGRSHRAAGGTAGFSGTAVRNWLGGEIPTDSDIVRALADGLGYPRAPLLDAADYKVTCADRRHDRDRYPDRIAEHPDLYADIPPELLPFLRLGRVLSMEGMNVLGSVPCGPAERREQAPLAPRFSEVVGGDFILQATGDSMEPFFRSGDYMVVRLTQEAEEGDIVIALVEGDVLCKRHGGTVTVDGVEYLRLEPTNHRYRALVAREVTVQGVVVADIEVVSRGRR